MKRIFAMLMALALLVSGLALAEETGLEPVLEDVTVEAEVEAEAEAAPAEEEGEILFEEDAADEAEAALPEEAGEELAEANEGEALITVAVKNKKSYSLYEGEKIQLAVAGQKIKSCKMKDKKSKKVASVTKAGVVTAKAGKAGKSAKVVITTKKNKKLTITIKVVAKPQPYTGELMEFLGMTIDDAVTKAGGNKALIRKDALSSVYDASGIALETFSLGDAGNKYFGRVSVIVSTTPTASVLGIAPGMTQAEAEAVIAGTDFEKEAGQVDAYLRTVEDGGIAYDESLVLEYENGAVKRVGFMSFIHFDEPEQDDYNAPAVTELTDLIGLSLEEAVPKAGGTMDQIRPDTDRTYFDNRKYEVYLCMINEPEGSKNYNKVNQVESMSADYTVCGVACGATAADAKAKLGKDFILAEESASQMEFTRSGEEGNFNYTEDVNVDLGNGKVTDIYYTIYAQALSGPTEPTEPEEPQRPTLNFAKELTDYIGQDLATVVRAIGGDVKDISDGYEGRWTSYDTPYYAIGLQAYKDMETTNKFYDKVNYILCAEKGHTIRGIAIDDSQANAQTALEAMGYAYSMESAIEGGVFRIYNKEYTENGVDYTEEVQFNAVNGVITSLWFHTY